MEVDGSGIRVAHSYTWHGGSRRGSRLSALPPHCFGWPLLCPTTAVAITRCLPPEWCYCCINGVIYIRSTADFCQAQRWAMLRVAPKTRSKVVSLVIGAV